MQDLQSWLAQTSADGIHIGLKELLYYQGKTALMDLNPKRGVQAKLAGSYLAKTKGRGMEFDEARHYQPGDDIRAIDWRVTARTGKTHTKVFREEKERPIFLLTDLSGTMHFGTRLLLKSVQAAHLSALVAWSAKQRGDRIGGLVFNGREHLEFKPKTRQKAVLALLNGLTRVHHPMGFSSRGGLTEALARVRRLAHPGSMVIVISDFDSLDEIAMQHMRQLSRHCEIVAYPISDPFEHELPEVSVPQALALTDGDSRQVVLVGEKQTQQDYRQNHARDFDAIYHNLRQCQAQVLPISAAASLEAQLRMT